MTGAEMPAPDGQVAGFMTAPSSALPVAGPAGSTHTADAADDPIGPAALTFGADGLIAAVAQQYDTGEVLMLAWMDAEAIRRTLATGAVTYFSRSRQEYWVKGATSGNSQRLIEMRRDCDGDALLVLVDQTGPACHTGTRSCFTRQVGG